MSVCVFVFMSDHNSEYLSTDLPQLIKELYSLKGLS